MPRTEKIRQEFIRTGTMAGGIYYKRRIYVHSGMLFSLCDALAGKFMGDHIEIVVAASERNAVISHLVAYILGHVSAGRNIPGIYAERLMLFGTIPWTLWRHVLRFGKESFEYEKLIRGKRVLIVEEALGARCSTQKIVEVIRYLGGIIVGVGAFYNNSDEISPERIDVPKLATLVSAS